MKVSGLLSLFTLLFSVSHVQAQEPGRNAPPPPNRFVVVGDSLSAGVQNFSLLDSQQSNGYAALIAKQAGWPLTLPLVPFPGVPNVLQLISVGPPPIIEAAPGMVTSPRDNPLIQPTNIAVPGLTVATALTLRPDLNSTNPEQQWATVVLGFPSLLQGKAPTEVELANSLQPSTLIEWLGNNDALVPSLIGQLSALTPVDQFSAAYEQVLDSLPSKGVKLITATVPDVTEIAFFTSARDIAAQHCLPLSTVIDMLKIGPNDYVRPSAASFIDGILSGTMQGPLPATCPTPIVALGVPTVPCVLTQADAQRIRASVDAYNRIIQADTASHNGILVDIHALVDQIHTNGYVLPDITLTTRFFGGLFSLDGMHPSNTGYGVIANEFIKTMNSSLGTTIPQANIAQIFASDPLAKFVTPIRCSATRTTASH
jgi:hypothetical protein